MINTHWLKLLLSRTYLHGSKGARAIEVLYIEFRVSKLMKIDSFCERTILNKTINLKW